MLEEAELVAGQEPPDGEVVVGEDLEERVEGAAAEAEGDVVREGVQRHVLHQPRQQLCRLL